MSYQKSYRVAVIGTGWAGNANLEAALALEGRIAGAAVVNPDAAELNAFSDRHGITARYTDADAMLSDFRPDIVLIATPPALHADLVVRSLRAGAHVLCEKPLCRSLAELDAIHSAERETGKVCASVVQWRVGSAGMHIRRLIREGSLGAPLLAICQTTWYRTQAYHEVDWRGRWDNEGGGVTYTLGIHAMDFFLWLWDEYAGGWASVTALAATLDRDIEVDNLSMAQVKFASGAAASIVNSAISPRERTYMRLDHQRGTVEVDALYGHGASNWTITPIKGVPEAESATWRSIPDTAPANHMTQMRQFVEALDRDETPPGSAGDIRRTLEFITCLYKSAFTGQIVTRGSVTPDDPFYHALNGKPGG